MSSYMVRGLTSNFSHKVLTFGYEPRRISLSMPMRRSRLLDTAFVSLVCEELKSLYWIDISIAIEFGKHTNVCVGAWRPIYGTFARKRDAGASSEIIFLLRAGPCRTSESQLPNEECHSNLSTNEILVE